MGPVIIKHESIDTEAIAKELGAKDWMSLVYPENATLTEKQPGNLTQITQGDEMELPPELESIEERNKYEVAPDIKGGKPKKCGGSNDSNSDNDKRRISPTIRKVVHQ